MYLITNQSKYPFQTSTYNNVSIKSLYEFGELSFVGESNVTESYKDISSTNLFSFDIGRGNSSTNMHSSSSTYENRLSDPISILRESSTNYRHEFYDEKDLLEKLEPKYLNISIKAEFSSNNLSDSCKIAVCLTNLRVITVPFECIDLDASIELISSQYIFMTETAANNSITCNYELIDCSKELKDNFTIIKNQEYIQSIYSNSFSYGDYGLPTEFEKVSKNKKYSLELTEEGNLVFKYRNKKIWDNKMGFFKESDYEIRIRINEKGHLIEGNLDKKIHNIKFSLF